MSIHFNCIVRSWQSYYKKLHSEHLNTNKNLEKEQKVDDCGLKLNLYLMNVHSHEFISVLFHRDCEPLHEPQQRLRSS